MGSFGLQDPAHYKYHVYKGLGFWTRHLSHHQPSLFSSRSSADRAPSTAAAVPICAPVTILSRPHPRTSDEVQSQAFENRRCRSRRAAVQAVWSVARSCAKGSVGGAEGGGGAIRILCCILEECDCITNELDLLQLNLGLNPYQTTSRLY